MTAIIFNRLLRLLRGSVTMLGQHGSWVTAFHGSDAHAAKDIQNYRGGLFAAGGASTDDE